MAVRRAEGGAPRGAGSKRLCDGGVRSLGLPEGVTPDTAKQSRERSSSGSRANAAAAGAGEKRMRNRNMFESNN
eukprot:11176600-Alexandrium_andersonii.AAC.1